VIIIINGKISSNPRKNKQNTYIPDQPLNHISQVLGLTRWISGRCKLLHLEALKSFLVSPGLDWKIRFGIETHSEDYNREEACDVTWKLPIFPLARLSWRRRSPVHEISFGSFFVTRCRPPAWTSRCGSRSEVDPVSERLRCDNQWLRRRHFCDSDFTLSDILMIRRK